MTSAPHSPLPASPASPSGPTRKASCARTRRGAAMPAGHRRSRPGPVSATPPGTAGPNPSGPCTRQASMPPASASRTAAKSSGAASGCASGGPGRCRRPERPRRIGRRSGGRGRSGPSITSAMSSSPAASNTSTTGLAGSTAWRVVSPAQVATSVLPSAHGTASKRSATCPAPGARNRSRASRPAIQTLPLSGSPSGPSSARARKVAPRGSRARTTAPASNAGDGGSARDGPARARHSSSPARKSAATSGQPRGRKCSAMCRSAAASAARSVDQWRTRRARPRVS